MTYQLRGVASSVLRESRFKYSVSVIHFTSDQQMFMFRRVLFRFHKKTNLHRESNSQILPSLPLSAYQCIFVKFHIPQLYSYLFKGQQKYYHQWNITYVKSPEVLLHQITKPFIFLLFSKENSTSTLQYIEEESGRGDQLNALWVI